MISERTAEKIFFFFVPIIAAAVTGGLMYFFGFWGLLSGCLIIFAYEWGYKRGSGEWIKPYRRDDYY